MTSYLININLVKINENDFNKIGISAVGTFFIFVLSQQILILSENMVGQKVHVFFIRSLYNIYFYIIESIYFFLTKCLLILLRIYLVVHCDFENVTSYIF